jgi:hypothetical protein
VATIMLWMNEVLPTVPERASVDQDDSATQFCGYIAKTSELTGRGPEPRP